MKQKVKAILYDLDGTIISTSDLHEKAWLHAGYKIGKKITKDHLAKQKGITNEDASRMILEHEHETHGKRLIRHKLDFVVNNVSEVELYEDFLDAMKKLKQKKIKVGIVTSSDGEFVSRIFSHIPKLSSLSRFTLPRERYIQGKPSAEPLLRACIQMKLYPEEIMYVGDAFTDYECAMNAGCSFVHFAPKRRDPGIPKTVTTIKDHRHIVRHIR